MTEAGAIGIFGGTFDPIHFGHLRAALEMKELLGLGEVRMVPCQIPPHRGSPGATVEQRLAMLQLALTGQGALSIDERELQRSGPSYMVDTLASLRDEVGERPLCLLLGLDAFLGLHKWHRWERIIELGHIAVATRPGWDHGELASIEPLQRLLTEHESANVAQINALSAGTVQFVPITPLAISATAIRDTVAQGRSPAYLMPDEVVEFIQQHGLYRDINEQ